MDLEIVLTAGRSMSEAPGNVDAPLIPLDGAADDIPCRIAVSERFARLRRRRASLPGDQVATAAMNELPASSTAIEGVSRDRSDPGRSLAPDARIPITHRTHRPWESLTSDQTIEPYPLHTDRTRNRDMRVEEMSVS